LREVHIALSKKDFKILNRFRPGMQPVGVKCPVRAPKDVSSPDGKSTFCGMPEKVQGGDVSVDAASIARNALGSRTV
jgi:hypothetical protein